jgi:hypothetical protein
MRKFSKIEVIMTDDEGYLALKGLLPAESILWARNVDKKIVICLKPEIDLDYLEKNFNSLHRTLHLLS